MSLFDNMNLLKGYKEEFSKLQSVLILEREHRENVEKEAIDLLKKVKEKYEKNAEKTKESYENKIKLLEDQIESLNSSKNEILKNKNDLDNNNKLNNVSLNEIDYLRRKCEEIQLTCTHKENEISNLKLDLRIANRDTNRNQEQIKYLREINKELKDKIDLCEKNLYNFEHKKVSNNEEILKLKDELVKIEKDNLNKILGLENEKNILEKEIKSLYEKINNFLETEKNMENLQDLYNECLKKNMTLTQQIEQLENDKLNLNNQIDNLKNLLKVKEENLNKQNSLIKVLTEQCSTLEAQLDKFNENLFENEIILNENKNLNNQIVKIKTDHLTLEKKLKNYENEMNEKINALIKEKSSYENNISNLEIKLENEIENNSNYLKELFKIQNELSSKEIEILNYENQISRLQKNLNEIKEEAAVHITNYSNLKTKNYSLTKMCEELNQKFNLTKNRICTLLEENDKKDSKFEQDRVKYQETINQQAKLIDYLHELSKKFSKKSWFSHSEFKNCKTSILSNSPLTNKKTNHEKEVESALEREKYKNRVLLSKITQMNAALVEYEQEKKNNQFKRKYESNSNENIEGNKQLKRLSSSPTAPPMYSENITSCSLKSGDIEIKKIENDSQHQINEEEFTFTESILDDIAYSMKEKK